MQSSNVLILTGADVLDLLDGREREVVDAVAGAYVAHRRGQSALPHSTFLRFPDDPRSRIIALPAYLGGELEAAGMKWISSFPANRDIGLDRASAVVVMNSPRTGRPLAILEGSIISAKRTAASAALAARVLHEGCPGDTVGFLGCGLINHEIARFLAPDFPSVRRVLVHDTSDAAAARFAQRIGRFFPEAEREVVRTPTDLLTRARLTSIATTALAPFIGDISPCQPDSTILHISLRDIAPEAILAADNVVDDLDHVCRAETSIHLASQKAGGREFVRCTLGDVLCGDAPARRDGAETVVFSPFGLGILDLAVGRLALEHATRHGMGLTIESFLPESWSDRD